MSHLAGWQKNGVEVSQIHLLLNRMTRKAERRHKFSRLIWDSYGQQGTFTLTSQQLGRERLSRDKNSKDTYNSCVQNGKHQSKKRAKY